MFTRTRACAALHEKLVPMAGRNRRCGAVAAATLATALLLSSCGSSSAQTGPRIHVVVHSLTTWPSTAVWGASCPQVGACVAVGERDNGVRFQTFFVEQKRGAWSAPIPLGPWLANGSGGPMSVACSSRADCASTTPEYASLSAFSATQSRIIGSHVLP